MTTPAPGAARTRRSSRALACLALLSLASATASAANVAQWHETGSAWRGGASGRWAVFTREVARDLTYHLAVDAGSPALAGRLRATVRHAMDAWESIADITFREVRRRDRAQLDIVVSHDGSTGYHYHGAGDATAPVRGADGRFARSTVRLRYRGDPDVATAWREDSWVWVAAHELGHALGLWHEFERTDRDRYVRAAPDPVVLGRMAPARGDAAGTEYDEASLMHYAWSDGDRHPPYDLVRPDGRTPIASVNYYERTGFSRGDIEIAGRMYGRAPGATPLAHRAPPPPRPGRIAGGAWTVRDAADPGAVRLVGDGVAIVQQRAATDHWVGGGDPPRLERAIEESAFVLAVDVDARYTFAGTHAGIFVVLGRTDWIYFGPFEHPHSIRAQRTGRGLVAPLEVDSHRYRLEARLARGVLTLGVIVGERRSLVARFAGLDRPESVAVGMKSWGPAARTYRAVRFASIDFARSS